MQVLIIIGLVLACTMIVHTHAIAVDIKEIVDNLPVYFKIKRARRHPRTYKRLKRKI